MGKTGARHSPRWFFFGSLVAQVSVLIRIGASSFGGWLFCFQVSDLCETGSDQDLREKRVLGVRLAGFS
jgi:hypothetical protein